ncbi:MAG: cytochrome-c peroxidase [Saprospiraceae bacterium]|jgi:cytochrome c peroxidase|nr:cytochrome-c peroxidase [Saprospiraceae bacterium]
MKNNTIKILTTFLLITIGILSCGKDDDDNSVKGLELILPELPFDYVSLNLPSHFTKDVPNFILPTSINGMDNTPQNNLITNHGATLGRVLFYDKKLSANGTISCSSCHKQEKGFSDDIALSVGFNGSTTFRNSMTLINARYNKRGRFLWDEKASTLEEQVLLPFQNPVEMGLNLDKLVKIVREQSYYPELFKKAFGNQEINSDKISKALSQFIRSIVSYSSKYDEGRAVSFDQKVPFQNFTNEENLGKNLFFLNSQVGGGSCDGCHITEAFINSEFGTNNNGLDANSLTDLGVGGVFNEPLAIGHFKTTSLRNIELTAPYMHDGRFKTLEEVVEHYNSGIQNHPTLSTGLSDFDGNPIRLNFSDSQKAALVAFLKTLTDNKISIETKWSNPFK